MRGKVAETDRTAHGAVAVQGHGGQPRKEQSPTTSADQVMAEIPPVKEEDEADPNPTLPEELDYESVRKELQKYGRVLRRRKKRRANELSAVEAQQCLV